MSATIQTITSVDPHGENLSIVTTSEGHQVIANRREDGSFRWTVGETVAYVSEGSIVPDDVLKARGYWDTEKDRGLLDGGKRNRVKMKKLAGFESRGLLFKVSPYSHPSWPEFTNVVARGEDIQGINVGDDVTEFLGITEFAG
jgi:hypothetical protein